jgi:hypothetical protein
LENNAKAQEYGRQQHQPKSLVPEGGQQLGAEFGHLPAIVELQKPGLQLIVEQS